jgi:hypothetical protein
MRGIDNRAATVLSLTFQELQEVMAGEKVQINGDLVQQQDSPGSKEAHTELHTSTLAVGNGVQVPGQINVQDSHQLVAPIWIMIASFGFEELGDCNVAADDWV